MASPTTSVLDPFTGTTALSSNWSKQFGSSTSSCSSDVWTPSGYSEYWWNAAGFNPSIEAYSTISTRATVNNANHGTYLSIMSGWATGSEVRSGYVAVLTLGTASDNVRVDRYVAGTPTIGFVTAVTLSTRIVAGDKWLFTKEAGGALKISVFQSSTWTQILSGSDGSPFFESTNANIGLGAYDASNTWRLDDFGGGAIASGGVNVTAAVATSNAYAPAVAPGVAPGIPSASATALAPTPSFSQTGIFRRNTTISITA